MKRLKQLKQWRSLGILAVSVTSAVITLQCSGALQFLEWVSLNQWFRLRPLESRTVPIVLVTITESDIQQANQWPLSDAQLAALLNRIKRDRPAAIGLDLYRDLPVQPGHTELLSVFKTTPNLIGITKAISNTEGSAVPPPPILRDREQIGFNDLLVDADGVVRRNLLSVQRDGKDQLALGAKLALMYLKRQGIMPEGGANGTCVRLAKANFCRLNHNEGGYVQVNTKGNQILSNFLQIPGGIPSVTLSEAMNAPNSLFQDKIVLVGTTAESIWGNRFYTPYTTNSKSTWAGVEIHANLAAQIISSALDNRPVLQGLPELWEWGWTFLWAGVGTVLGWSMSSSRWTILFIALSVGSILGTAYSLFLIGWWAIVISPLLSFSMTALLSRSYWVWKTLKQTNQFLELKIQERTQELIEKNADVYQALEKERELNELKSRFISTASHEFRTPLAVISSSVGILQDYGDRLNPDQTQKQLQHVQKSINQITQLLDDVLMINRADLSGLNFNPAPLNIVQFCRGLVEEMQLCAPQHAINLAIINEREPVRHSNLQLDEKLLQRILTNLLSNATKYSPPGSTVDFKLICQPESVAFQIRDEGIGIPKEDQDHLFESFHRAKNVGLIPGTGLGLAIVRKCVDLHSGEIVVHSQVGTGTTFTVTLPLKQSSNWSESESKSEGGSEIESKTVKNIVVTA